MWNNDAKVIRAFMEAHDAGSDGASVALQYLSSGEYTITELRELHAQATRQAKARKGYATESGKLGDLHSATGADVATFNEGDQIMIAAGHVDNVPIIYVVVPTAEQRTIGGCAFGLAVAEAQDMIEALTQAVNGLAASAVTVQYPRAA